MSSLRVTRAKKVSEVKALHLLPFAVVPQDEKPSQEARVSDYFLPQNGSASFRGRALRGVELPVPESYVGVVAIVAPREKRKQEDEDDEDEDEREKSNQEERKGSVVKTFSSFTLWEHDTAPAEGDLPFEWVKWPKLASALNVPVAIERIEAKKETEPAL
jgi:hypothetical protein